MADEPDRVDALFQTEAAPAVEVAPEQPQEPVAQPEATPQPEPAPEPQPDMEPKPEHTVPLAKFLDQRDELKELRRFREEAERARAQSQPNELPDPVDDPNGFARSLDAKVQAALETQRFELSFELATDRHGKDKVEAARAWALEKAAADPGFQQAVATQRNPFDWIVRQHQRDGLVSQLPSDVSSLDELIEREIAKRSQSAQPAAPASAGAAPQQPSVRPAMPPRSIASESSTPATVSNPTADFMDIFAKR